MKKRILLSSIVWALSISPAHADSLVIQGTIGDPYVAAPAYPVYPTYPAYVYDERWPAYHRDEHWHRHDWKYWHHDNRPDRDDRDHDHDHDRGRH